MKFKVQVAALLAALATTCFAQSVNITLRNNTSVPPGGELNLDLQFIKELFNTSFFASIFFCKQDGPMAGMTNSICNDPSSLQYTFIESKFVNDPEDAVSNGTAQSLKVTIPLKVNTSAFTQISTPKGPAAISVVYYGNLTDSPIPAGGPYPAAGMASITVNIT